MAYPKRRRIVICAFCGKSFERMLSRYDGENAYCCIEHRNEHYGINRPSPDILRELHDTFPSWSAIAEELGVAAATVSDWMRACGLKSHRTVARERNRRIDTQGYVKIRTPNGWKAEHREVMAAIEGRPLLPTEEVHHLNGNKQDNSPSNLELWHRSHPKAQRLRDLPHCPTCTCWQTKTESELIGNNQSWAEPKRPGPLVVSW